MRRTGARGGATPRTRPLVHTTGDRHTQRPCRAHEVTFFCVTTWFPRARRADQSGRGRGGLGARRGSRLFGGTAAHAASRSASGRRAAPASSSSWHGSCSRTRYDASTHESGREGSDEKRRASHARSSGSAGWGGAAGSLTKQRRLGGTGGGGEARRRGGDGTARGFPPRSRQSHTKRKATLLVPWPLQPSTLLLGAHERK